MLCVLAVTAYLAVTAWEDYRTCEVTRWKHFIGGIPAFILFFVNWNRHGWGESAITVAFALIYIAIGYAGVYGFADGLILANLSLFFGSIGGLAGSGMVLLIMVIAAFSFLFCHVIKSVVNHRNIFRNMSGALIPHILAAYVVVVIITISNV